MSRLTENLLWNLHWSLYEKAYDEATSLPIIRSPKFLQYAKNFEKILPKNFKLISFNDLLGVMHSSNIVLYGDFHTFKQSQKGFVRLIRHYGERYSFQDVIIAVECFKAVDQNKINKFIQGKIDEKNFLNSTNYFQEWGFPWENYKSIFDLAKQNNLQVVGINSKTKGKNSLKRRDNFCAKILLNVLKENPGKKIFCIIGEYHLADKHLPLSLKAHSQFDLSIIRILNNVDRYYFELNMFQANQDIYLYLKEDLYCVMNAPLWIKWQSLTNWEEFQNSQVSQFENTQNLHRADLNLVNNYNLENQFMDILENLSDFLHLNFNLFDVNKINICFDAQALQDNKFTDLLDMSMHDLSKATFRAIKDGFYILDNNCILLSNLSLNTIAEAAGQYLYMLSNNNISFNNLSIQEKFFFRVLKYVAGMISSRILNPRRKIEDFFFYQNLINEKSLPLGYQKIQLFATKLAFKYHEWFVKNIKNFKHKRIHLLKSIHEEDIQLNYEVSKILGYIVGSLLCNGVFSGTIAIDVLRNFFTTPVQNISNMLERFADIYSNFKNT